MQTKTNLVLYGAPCSLFTAKARACFRKNAIGFEERFQSHPRYREHVLPTAKNHRIPVVEFSDGAIIQDSTLILDEIEARHPSVPRTSGALRVIDLFVEAFADRSLLKAAMHYRWNFPDENLAFIREVFAELERTKPPGLHYASFRLADGVSFLHVAQVDVGIATNPLLALEAFQRFTRDIRDRCEEPPVSVAAEPVGLTEYAQKTPCGHCSSSVQ